MKTYVVVIPKKIWGDELIRYLKAESSGAAKYKYWLRYADCYNMTFGEFLKEVKCWVVKEDGE